MTKPPVQVVFVWRPSDEERNAGKSEAPLFIEASRRALTGRLDNEPRLHPKIHSWISGKSLEPVEIEDYSLNLPQNDIEEILDGSLHTLFVVWVDDQLIKDTSYVKWLVDVWNAVDGSDERDSILIGLSNEQVRDRLFNAAMNVGGEALQDCQIVTWESLGEDAARPCSACLNVLVRIRDLLESGTKGGVIRKLQLFVSHAKNDGFALANSLVHSIENIPGIEKFYDAIDIQNGTNWRRELQKGVENSVLIVIRTDEYDDREWCVKEVTVADSAGVPIIVVEGRAELFHPPTLMSLECSPWVRIPDGSLTRVVYCALRENLRQLIIRRGIVELGPEVHEATTVLPRLPTWDSLDGAVDRLSKNNRSQKFIVYPDPPLPPNTIEAVNRFAQSRDPSIRVSNYKDFIEQLG